MEPRWVPAALRRRRLRRRYQARGDRRDGERLHGEDPLRATARLAREAWVFDLHTWLRIALFRGAMHHFFRIVAFGLTCLAVPTPAAADPISITSGSIVVTDLVSIGTISIAGTRGFSIEGSVDPNEGRVDPINACPCLAGTTISLVAVLSGSAVVGTATLDGNQYELTGSIEDPAGVSLELVGTAMLPQLVSSATVVIAPFSVTASSVFVFDGGSVPLNGSGIASLSLSPTFPVPNESPLWMVDQVRYDFAPVPEPSTMTLITLGLAATTLRARMRRRGTRPEGERRPG
jgi:hypothetical protein